MTEKRSDTTGTEPGGIDRRTYLKAAGAAGLSATALGGLPDTAKGATQMQTITISGTGELTQYHFSVDGAIEATSGLTGEDSHTDANAEGAIRGGMDSYYYTGELTALEVDGNATVGFGTGSPPESDDSGGDSDDDGGSGEKQEPTFGADFANIGELDAYEEWLGRDNHISDGYVGGVRVGDYESAPGWLLDTAEQFVARDPQNRMCWDFKLKNTDLEGGANGDYNHYFEAFGDALVDRGMGDSFVRPAAEFDLGHTIHPENESEAELFGEYLQQIAEVMYTVDGGNFEMVWNPATELDWRSDAYIEGCWPGAEYVDYVGVDMYDRTWRGPYNDEPITLDNRKEAWDIDTQPYLDWIREFARSHGDLPVCLPEWGCWSRQNDSRAGGDNPYFVQQMHDWMNNPDNNVAWHVYFEGLDKHGLSQPETRMPDASAKFKELFG